MTTPAPEPNPPKYVYAEHGWNAYTAAMSQTIPLKLAVAKVNRRAILSLIKPVR